ncbi:ranBP-type and C3HC4-type zinc finger-containing protein 1 [Caerostris extrusa]|uniref:RanBP-type and C3HC4-type zinc finger-containing protein 1 n=1 Tax=Caerostris extrusa TaxID=172846 RepID=A0AAV4N7C2_CAEEX|nr:ranBP-type and C3HC4-type zinc finger-containing protein 1 [Caerostris extrusa]
MSCDLCQHGSHVCQAYSRHPNFEHPHYADVPDDVDEEPEAPTLSLGNRILWLTETRAASGIVRWIGRIPAISAGWSAGIEFDNVMPNGGNGDFRGRNFSLLVRPCSIPPCERTFFGRLQDSCSNFAHRRRRDSTFGHFKAGLCFCMIYEVCSVLLVTIMVYIAIIIHMAMLQAISEMPDNRQFVRHHRSHSREDSIRLPDQEIKKAIDYPRYRDNEFGEMTMTRKESMFNPRSSLRFINGFKEWVSCLVLGTNRRKSKKKTCPPR